MLDSSQRHRGQTQGPDTPNLRTRSDPLCAVGVAPADDWGSLRQRPVAEMVK